MHEPLSPQAKLAGEIRAVLGKLKRQLRDKAPPGNLSWSQAHVLGRLERDGPATLTALARTENMRSQSMGAIVGPMEAAGLVAGARTRTTAGRPCCRSPRSAGTMFGKFAGLGRTG